MKAVIATFLADVFQGFEAGADIVVLPMDNELTHVYICSHGVAHDIEGYLGWQGEPYYNYLSFWVDLEEEVVKQQLTAIFPRLQFEQSYE
jgi:hypothetical protein